MKKYYLDSRLSIGLYTEERKFVYTWYNPGYKCHSTRDYSSMFITGDLEFNLIFKIE